MCRRVLELQFFVQVMCLLLQYTLSDSIVIRNKFSPSLELPCVHVLVLRTWVLFRCFSGGFWSVSKVEPSPRALVRLFNYSKRESNTEQAKSRTNVLGLGSSLRSARRAVGEVEPSPRSLVRVGGVFHDKSI